MKKLFVTLFALIFTFAAANAADTNTQTVPEKQPAFNQKAHAEHIKREKAFEQKLGLTEEQKVQARELRKQGFIKMRPVIEQIKLKKQEAKALKNSDKALKDQSEQLKAIDKDIKKLEKLAREIRKANMKEFEAILTSDQKKILKEMKAEGRKNFKANHPCGRPPMPQKPVEE